MRSAPSGLAHATPSLPQLSLDQARTRSGSQEQVGSEASRRPLRRPSAGSRARRRRGRGDGSRPWCQRCAVSSPPAAEAGPQSLLRTGPKRSALLLGRHGFRAQRCNAILRLNQGWCPTRPTECTTWPEKAARSSQSTRQSPRLQAGQNTPKTLRPVRTLSSS